MDAVVFARMLTDKSITDLGKMRYKYSAAELQEFLTILKTDVYKTLPLRDAAGNELVYLDSVARLHLAAAKALLTPQRSSELFGLKAMEKEIASTLTIENIEFARDSVRKILKGYAPADESEKRIFGLKKGLEFISDPSHKITAQNLHTLYQLAIGDYLKQEDRLLSANFYRHDSVYIVGQGIEHVGLAYQKLPEYMAELLAFINTDSCLDDLLQAAVIHFYIAWLHPYFDGNGRLARLVHLWYLVQRGYSSTLFIPFSEYIEKSRSRYYRAYSLCEQNAVLSGVLDVTPFLVYFIDNVYHKLGDSLPPASKTETFRQVLASGLVTEKEKDLWYFVLSAYGEEEFSTKQLEKDYGNAAYATIRSFVLKFTKLGLLTGQKYSNKVKYRCKL